MSSPSPKYESKILISVPHSASTVSTSGLYNVKNFFFFFLFFKQFLANLPLWSIFVLYWFICLFISKGFSFCLQLNFCIWTDEVDVALSWCEIMFETFSGLDVLLNCLGTIPMCLCVSACVCVCIEFLAFRDTLLTSTPPLLPFFSLPSFGQR